MITGIGRTNAVGRAVGLNEDPDREAVAIRAGFEDRTDVESEGFSYAL